MFKPNQYLIMAFTFLLCVGLLSLGTLTAKDTAKAEDREQVQNATTVMSEIMGVKEGEFRTNCCLAPKPSLCIPTWLKAVSSSAENTERV